MCGISGELRADNGAPDIRSVAAITDAMIRRGPDGGGLWSQQGVALGHRRLQIIDLSPRGQQPMVDPELGLTIVFNGCIYNYRELREELSALGHRFFSTSDTEVIPKAYSQWGPGFVERLNGMFAFCIVEHATGRALLGRDRLGIKPLYLAEVDGGLRFASSLPAILEGGGVNTSIDPVALHHYLTFHAVVPAPHTILQGVRKLPPATLLQIDADGTRREEVYWRPSFERRAEREDMSERDWEDAILEGFRKAVRRRLVADVPVGVLLSGGLDSSLVVGLLAEEGQHGLQTFSVGFESVGDVEGNEFRYSDVVAKRFETDHHQIRVGADRLATELLPTISAMSEPMVSHDAIGFYLLSQEVAKHVKVVQSGQGADEIFAGYHWYPPMMQTDDALGSYRKAFFDRTHQELNQLVSAEYRLDQDASAEFVRAHFDLPGASRPIDKALRLDTQIMLVDDPVKRVDNMTMAWGLEARVPFLDHELVELAASCPPELKVAHGGKGVLKEAARRVIPHEVIDRPKGYFPVPAITYLSDEPLELITEALRSPSAKDRGLFEQTAVERYLADPNGSHTPLRGNELWQIGLLELWLQQVVG
ncbi:MAG: N-acetylglutaminylglutamine amidotransferase [Actinomycetota bacterium]